MKAIRIIIVLLALALVSLIWQVGSMLLSQKEIVNFPPKNRVVVALGDSLTVGVGSREEEGGFVGILSRRLGVPIENRGVSGDTTGMALARLENDVLRERPGIVIVLLGGNDTLRKIPEAETFKNLRTIIGRLHEDGAVVLLLGVRGGLLSDRFAEDFEALAEETGVVFVPNILDGVFGNAALMHDEIHPNDAGYIKIADRVAPELLLLIESAPRPSPPLE